MDFYVVAFVGQPMPRRRIGGRWYEGLSLGRVVAVGERRQALPVATDLELEHQHEVVVRLAERVDAILPVRFGAMTSLDTLEEMPARLRERLAAGLDDVRGKTQMTVRFVGQPRPVSAKTVPAKSGREYLLKRQAAARPDLPAEATAWLESLSGVVARQRIEPGAGSVLATVYHLVRNADLDRYGKATADADSIGARVTGPFPPFAFTPSVL